MLCIEPCESFTQNLRAPPPAAPSMQAFASSVIQRRARSYSTPCIITWLYVATPPMPSISMEIHTLVAARLGMARWYEVESCAAFAIEEKVPRYSREWVNGETRQGQALWYVRE